METLQQWNPTQSYEKERHNQKFHQQNYPSKMNTKKKMKTKTFPDKVGEMTYKKKLVILHKKGYHSQSQIYRNEEELR